MPLIRSVLLLTSILLLLIILPSSAMASDLSTEPTADKPLLSSLPCTIILDDNTQNVPSLCVNQMGQSMVSLKDAAQLFSCKYVFQPDGTLQVSYADIVQTFLPQEYINTAPLENLTPIEQLDVVCLPLRKLAQGFSYVVMYKSQGPLIVLQSPNYQEIIPDPPDNLPTWGTMGSELGTRWRYKTMIGSFYTTLINSSEGRTNNVILACEKINGTIVNSGEIFSFNNTVGQRSSQAGYKDAPIFSGNKVIDGIGGGICQASSTLYNATMASGLQVIERHPHSLPVKYCPPLLDATVSWGIEDYKFKNILDRPVQILCCVYGPYVLTAIVEVD